MSDQISPDELFKALANSRRRLVIRAIADGDYTTSDLAEIVAREENDLPAEVRVDDDLRKRAYVALYQNHLEKFESWEIVEWDTQSGQVTAGPAHGEVLRVLRLATGPGTDASLLDRMKNVVGGEA